MFPFVRTKVFSLGTLGVVGNVYRVPEHERFEQSAATHKHVSSRVTCRHVSRVVTCHVSEVSTCWGRGWRSAGGTRGPRPRPGRTPGWRPWGSLLLSRYCHVCHNPSHVTRHTWPVDAARLVPQHLHHAGHAELAAPAVTKLSQQCHAAPLS